jgi:excisionase family DNA binding protein
MEPQGPVQRRRGRPPKPVPVTPSWINEVDVALRICGLDPAQASITDVTTALVPHRRPARLPWQERILLPIVPVVCDLIGVSKAQVYKLAREGKLEMVRLGGRTSITTASLQRHLRAAMEDRTPAPPTPPQLVRGNMKRRNLVNEAASCPDAEREHDKLVTP